MSKLHTFSASNGVGSIGEALFYALLSRLGKVTSVVKDKTYQSQGIDFLLDGIGYDTKFDTMAASTGNVALEVVANDVSGKIGWALGTQAHCVAYIYRDGLDWVSLFFRPQEMKKLCAREYPHKTARNPRYSSEVVLVPLADLDYKKPVRLPILGEPSESSLVQLEKIHRHLAGEKNRARY